MGAWNRARVFFFLVITNCLVAVTLLGLVAVVGFIAPKASVKIKTLLMIVGAAFSVGMLGSLISLIFSRSSIIKALKVRVLNPGDSSLSPSEKRIVRRVHGMAQCMGLPPRVAKSILVGIYESDAPNAFATGLYPSRSLVSVSSSLLKELDETEQDGVVGHEIGHIVNGDVPVMGVLRGALRTFSVVAARLASVFLVFFFLRRARRLSESSWNLASWALTAFFERTFLILSLLLTAWFSRRRERNADFAGASVVGSKPLIEAFLALKKITKKARPSEEHALLMSGMVPSLGKVSGWFAMHFSLDQRIAQLKKWNLKPSKCFLNLPS